MGVSPDKTTALARVDDERQLRLGHHPLRVAAQMHGLTGMRHALRGGFEEDLGALCGIDTVVKAATSGFFALFHACGAAAAV